MEKQIVEIGDVIDLKQNWSVVKEYRAVVVLDQNVRCVVEDVRGFDAGREDDHFEKGVLVDARALHAADEKYDPAGALYTFALSGDFNPKYIHTDIEVSKKMIKTFTHQAD